MGRRPLCRVLVVLALSAGLAGCFGPAPRTAPQARGPVRSNPDDQAPSAGLDRLAAAPEKPAADDAAPDRSDLERRIAEQARLIQELQASNLIKPPPSTPKAAPVRPPAPTPTPTPIPETNAGLATFTTVTPPVTPPPASTPATTPPAAPAAETTAEPVKLAPITAPLDERLNTAADELAKALRERAALSRTPAAEYNALAWLDTLRPGVLGALDSGPASKTLDPRQVRSLTFTRDLAARFAAEPTLLNDPDRLWKAVTEVAQPITQAKDVRIASAELCAKVDGFGQYQPLASRTLLAGSAHSIIVYAEVDSYAYRRNLDPDGERFTVELGQAVEIWQDADRPTLQRRWGETTIKDVSRRQRRDFYITSVIELPPNLSVGAYNLKLIVKDHLRGAQAEKSVPFTIVADGSIIAASGQVAR